MIFNIPKFNHGYSFNFKNIPLLIKQSQSNSKKLRISLNRNAIQIR